MAGKTIITVIVAWCAYMAITKRGRKRKEKEDLSSSFPTTAERPSPPMQKYDVFLSFRGPDTRKGITSDIHEALTERGIKTFMDDQDLPKGAVISPTLLTAIRESRFAIVVLSRDYASSTWCLEELSEICRCMEGNSHTKQMGKQEDNRILPLFYEVDPTDVRHQKKSFGDAFTKHVKSGRHTKETVQQWRDALKQVANCSGWNSQDHRTHKELVKAVVEIVCSKVLPTTIESMEDFEEFEATRQAMNEVMRALKDDEVTAVGVYGMGGVGKTTLVKHVGSQACKNGIFDRMVMAVVSKNPDLEQIQHTLADLLGFKLEEKTESGRASRIHKEIMRKQNILIILDDIWEILNLSRIGIPSQDELKRCNSKVLLTTRRLNVCHVMKCQQKINLNILSKEDSGTLFLRNARVSFESTEFKDIARRVAEECKGLPIALIAVARALGDKEDMEEWETAIRRLKISQTANPDDEGDAFECIKLSYDYLKEEDFKSCFLLCCLFPEDCDIEIEIMFRYAIGNGLFRDDNTIQDARGTVKLVVNHLKNSSLLLNSEKDGCVRMHDVIRDTAIQIAQDDHGFWVKAGCGVSDWPRGLHKGYSAVSQMNNDIHELPEQLVFPELELLFLNYYLSCSENYIDVPETFFRISNKLRVLDLSQHYVSSLPQSLSLLTSLQTLHLDGCGIISNISLVGKLKKLEILSMKCYTMEELPREIGDLTNLRILDVSGGRIKTIPCGVISKLHKLEELYLQCDFCEWGSKVEGQRDEMNADFDEVTSLSNLRNLQVWIANAECIPANVRFNPNWVRFDIRVGPDTNYYFYGVSHRISRSLRLETPIDTFPDWFVNVVINKAVDLEYINCPGLIDLCVEYDCGRLHGLKNLTVRRLGDLGKPMTAITWAPKEAVFENLEYMYLCGLHHSEVLFLSDLPDGSLINLKKLQLLQCNWGSVLLPPKLLQRLPNLENLTCEYVDGMEYVVGCEGFEPVESKLRVLYLKGLQHLRSICDGPSPRAMFRSLESVTLYHCDIRGSLFTSDIVDCLFQLKVIDLSHCSFLERITDGAINKKTTLPKLKKLALDTLPMLIGTIDFECPSLEDLNVLDCPKFSFSVSDLHSKKQVQVRLDRPLTTWDYWWPYYMLELQD